MSLDGGISQCFSVGEGNGMKRTEKRSSPILQSLNGFYLERIFGHQAIRLALDATTVVTASRSHYFEEVSARGPLALAPESTRWRPSV